MKKQLRISGLFIIVLIILSTLILNNAYSQNTPMLDEDYDEKAKAKINIWEDDTPLLRKTKLKFIMRKVQQGDKVIMKLMTFDTMQAFHDDVVAKQDENDPFGYYEELGFNSSLTAWLGGLDNLDPHVRLKCLGYLGDWVDEVGENLNLIEKVIDQRLESNDEKRQEVRYAMRVVKMKIVRRKTLTKIKDGDKKVLQTIDPDDFMPLVFYEPRIRTAYIGKPDAINMNSVRLDKGVDPETGDLIGSRPGRAPGLDIERICYTFEVPEGQTEGITDTGRVAKNFFNQQKLKEQNKEVPVDVDTATLPNAEVIVVENEDDIDWPCVRAIYYGLNNKSVFVREHCARIFLNYMARFSADRSYMICNKKYCRKLTEFRDNPTDRRIAMVAWENTKWAEYYYSSHHGINLKKFTGYKNYFEADKNNFLEFTSTRYFTNYVQSFPQWETEQTGNYRNDVKEILRILGLGFYLDPKYSPEVLNGEKEGRIHYRYLLADTLFDESRPKITEDDDSQKDILIGETPVNN